MMDLIFDTGSDWLAVEGKGCSTCKGELFDGSKGKQTGTAETEKRYGSVVLKGSTWKDTVCLTFSTCVKDFEYYLISDQQGINGYQGLSKSVSGIMGMSREIVPDNITYTVGPLIVKQMYDQKLIKHRVFSFYLTEPGKMSFVDIGGLVPNWIKGAKKENGYNYSRIIWLVLNKDFYWSSNCQGISFGEQGD